MTQEEFYPDAYIQEHDFVECEVCGDLINKEYIRYTRWYKPNGSWRYLLYCVKCGETVQRLGDTEIIRGGVDSKCKK